VFTFVAAQGYTEITVLPQSKDLRTIHLHSRQCGMLPCAMVVVLCPELLTLEISVIHSVSVASQPADFVHNDPLANLSVSNPTDCHIHAELKRKVYSALAEGDEGELSIAVPKEAIIRQSGGVTGGFASEGV
jgi:transcription initiation factor TFIID subunit 2